MKTKAFFLKYCREYLDNILADKQMLINSDYGRVYEVGPVFRAEKSLTNRHLCEFTGLDIEITVDTGFMEVIETAWVN